MVNRTYLFWKVMSYNLERRLRDFLLEGFEKRDMEGSWERLLKEEKAQWYPQICSPSDSMTLFFLMGLDSVRKQFVFWSQNACVWDSIRKHFIFWSQNACVCLHKHGENMPIKSKESIDHCDLLICFSVSLRMKRFQISPLMWWEVLNWKTLILSFQINSSLVSHLRAGEAILMVTLAVFLWPPTCFTF